ncbi:MAG: EamA family transporter [Planctomycetes bacterium]|nr:EamA family transporter [Planctomycetota bacterium]
MPPTPTPLLVLGIVYGLLAAVAHAIAFAISRRYIVQGHGSSLRLMVTSHVMMGVLALAVLVPLWSDELLDVRNWILPMLGTSVTYLLGQALFFIGLRHTASSRLVPLLGLKVVAVAPLSLLLLGQKLGWPQLAAVALSLVAGAMLHHIGGRLPWRSLLVTLLAVCMFAVSDVFVFLLVPRLGTGFAASARSVGVCYGFCGLAALPLLPWQGSRRRADWLAAVPHVLIWLPSMYLLFACIALCGPILGNIVIGTRGLFAIVLGALLAWQGMLHLEHHSSRGVVLRRIAAAVLMILAIAIYGVR